MIPEIDDLDIRVATEADLPSIVEIYNQSIPERIATCDLEPVSVEERRPWFRQHGESHPIWVAAPGGRVEGWASISRHGERAGYDRTVENSVYVDRDARGRGLGRRLLEHTIEECRRLGHHVILARIFAHNEISLDLHAKLGFEAAGCLREVAWMDGVYRDVVYLQRIV